MTDQNRIFKCGECGHVVEAVHFGKGMINCCGKEMELLKEKTEDEKLDNLCNAIDTDRKYLKESTKVIKK